MIEKFTSDDLGAAAGHTTTPEKKADLQLTP